MRDGWDWSEGVGTELGRGILWAPALLALGILGFFQMPSEPKVVLILSSGLMALAAGGGVFFSPFGLRPLLWVVFFVGLGFAASGLRTALVAEPVLGWRYYGPVEGRVVALDRSASGALRVTLANAALGNMDHRATPELVRISLYGPDAEKQLPAGAWIMTTAHLSPPSGPAEPGGFDFQRHAWFQSLGAVGYTRVPVLIGAFSEDRHGFFMWRLALSARVQAVLGGQTGAFAAALMTGDRSALTPQTLSALRRSNLAHLLAISGLHMGLVAGFVFGALRLGLALLPRMALHGSVKKIAAAGALLAASGYLGLSGGAIATERAYIMAAVALGAVMLERRAISLRAVAIAAMLILLHRPEALLGPGFQMSFAATTALVAVFNTLSQRAAGKPRGSAFTGLIKGTIISSAVAGLATLPFAAAHFNQIAHYGLLANLVAVPLMGLWVIPLAVLAVCLIPVGLDGFALRLMGLGLDWILAVAEQMSTWPGAVSKVPAPPSWVFASLCIGLLMIAIMVTRLRWGGLVPVIVALVGWSLVERPYVLIADTGGMVGVMTPQGRALSKDKGAGFVAGIWLENDGDPALQYQAAARWPVETELGPGRLHVAHGKRGMTAFKGCKRGDIAVFSEVQDLDLPCTVFDAARLHDTGSIALTLLPDGGVKTQTARAVAGRRYWNEKGLRRSRLGHQ